MKRILVGLDGSPHQDDVLRGALAGGAEDAKLILMRVVSLPVELPPRMLTVAPDAVGSLLLDNARADLERLSHDLPAGRLEGIRVDLGSPWRALVDAAREIQADLLVIGSHGYGGIDRLLGTTAAKVVNHASCSVLVIRPSVTP